VEIREILPSGQGINRDSFIFHHGEIEPLRWGFGSCKTSVPGVKDSHEIVVAEASLPDFDECAHDVSYHMPQEAVRFKDESQKIFFGAMKLRAYHFPYRVDIGTSRGSKRREIVSAQEDIHARLHGFEIESMGYMPGVRAHKHIRIRTVEDPVLVGLVSGAVTGVKILGCDLDILDKNIAGSQSVESSFQCAGNRLRRGPEMADLMESMDTCVGSP
jgi:hypothetical protein